MSGQFSARLGCSFPFPASQITLTPLPTSRVRRVPEAPTGGVGSEEVGLGPLGIAAASSHPQEHKAEEGLTLSPGPSPSGDSWSPLPARPASGSEQRGT